MAYRRFVRRKSAPHALITNKSISLAASRAIKSEGIWVVVNLIDFELVHFPASHCHISKKNRCVFVKEKDGTPEDVLSFNEFNVRWNFSKKHLIEACEKMRFQPGIARSYGINV